jgi:hypothetical protein
VPAMSDRELVALLGEVIQELERRVGSERATSDLSRALEKTQVALRRLSHRRPSRRNPRYRADAAPSSQAQGRARGAGCGRLWNASL